ncbi:hypothetical protein ACSQ6I_07280, partial [Anabaena sp. WFMT]|uniref:hypothetical protein n=1 Tax=Anabaena sp. WFMT TaxID=3449730 RepID=UPI003F253ABD
MTVVGAECGLKIPNFYHSIINPGKLTLTDGRNTQQYTLAKKRAFTKNSSFTSLKECAVVYLDSAFLPVILFPHVGEVKLNSWYVSWYVLMKIVLRYGRVVNSGQRNIIVIPILFN